MEAVFHYDDIVRRTADVAGGLLSRGEREAALQRVLSSDRIVRLDRPKPSPDAAASLIHTRAYTSAHNLGIEREIHHISRELKEAAGFAIPPSDVAAKLEGLQSEGYPLSDEQRGAIRAATAAGRVAIIEGAAGSGKTTTLRPIADLYRDRGYRVIATAVPWRVTLELGNDLDAPNYCVDKLIPMVARERVAVDDRTVIFVEEAGMLSSAHAEKILRIARERGGGEADRCGGHGAAAAGCGGTGASSDPRRGGLDPGGHHPPPAGGHRGRAGRAVRGDAGGRAGPRGGDDGGRTGHRSRGLRYAAGGGLGQGQAVADRGLGSLPGRRRGGRDRRLCGARPVPPRARPPPHPHPPGRRLGRTPEERIPTNPPR